MTVTLHNNVDITDAVISRGHSSSHPPRAKEPVFSQDTLDQSLGAKFTLLKKLRQSGLITHAAFEDGLYTLLFR